MSGESIVSGGSEREPSAWTADTVLDHILGLTRARDAHLDERFATQNRSLEAALASINERLAAANEIRSAWQDDRAHLVTRVEMTALIDSLTERVVRQERVAERTAGHTTGADETRTNARSTSAVMIQAFGAITGILALAIALAALLAR